MCLAIKLKTIIKCICNCTQKDTILVAVSITYLLVVILPLSFVVVLYKFLAGPKKPHTKCFWYEISNNASAMIKITGEKDYDIIEKSYLVLSVYII